MSVQYDHNRKKFVVRWREDSKQRIRRFSAQDAAEAFDAVVNPNGRAAHARGVIRESALKRVVALHAGRTDNEPRDGVYPYATNRGVRWRAVYRQSDGTLSSRRGFTSRTAALKARRKLQESVDRGEVKVSRDTFETFWHRLVAERRAYMTAGSHQDLSTHGRLRLVPFFGADLMSKIDEDRVREWLGGMGDLVEDHELAAKTVNNARTWLSVAFNEAVRRGLMARNSWQHPSHGVSAGPAKRLLRLRSPQTRCRLVACFEERPSRLALLPLSSQLAASTPSSQASASPRRMSRAGHVRIAPALVPARGLRT